MMFRSSSSIVMGYVKCLARAVRHNAALIALHTSPIMEAALGLYRRMGFELERAAPDIHGVPYGIYLKRLADGACLRRE